MAMYCFAEKEGCAVAENCGEAVAAARKALTAQGKALWAPLEALKAEDAGAIHDVRVASRRLRAVLKETAPLVDKASRKKVQRGARRITKDLGRARELDVSLALLDTHRSSLHGPPRAALAHTVRVLQRLRAGQSGVIAQTAAWIESSEFNGNLQNLIDALGTRPGCHLKNAGARTTARFAGAVQAHGAWQKSRRDEDLHQLRIAFKKLRYTCEIYRGIYGARMAVFLKSLKKAQQWLGDWHDYCIILSYLAEAAPSAPPKARQGLPALHSAMAHEAAGALEQFIPHAESFFSPASQEKNRRFLHGVHHTCARNTRPPTPQYEP